MPVETDNFEYIELGKIIGVWGVKGWVKVHSHTRQKEDILNYKTWFLGEERKSHRLTAGHAQGSRIVASLDGLDNREVAQRHAGKAIAVRASDLPKLQEGDFYWRQIEGLKAVTTTGSKLGVVDRLFETGANDVMAIKCGSKEILVPYVQDIVRKVDLERGVIEVNWEAIS